MGARRNVVSTAGRFVAPKLPAMAPDLNASAVREMLQRAIHGVRPLPPAAAAAERRLRQHAGRDSRAVRAIVDEHVRYAGAQGLLTSLGGAVTAILTLPANLAGLALIQTRMVAAIAHARGYDLDDPRVRDAVLACLLGEEKVDELVRERKIPAPPMALATAPVHDPEVSRVLAAEVTAELVRKVAGKHALVGVARRVPIVGGVVGLGVDSVATSQIGRYASTELRPRARR